MREPSHRVITVATEFSASNDSSDWCIDASSIFPIGPVRIHLDGDGSLSRPCPSTTPPAPCGSPRYVPQPCPPELRLWIWTVAELDPTHRRRDFTQLTTYKRSNERERIALDHPSPLQRLWRQQKRGAAQRKRRCHLQCT